LFSNQRPWAVGMWRALDLLAPQGVILIDNVLWGGDVLK
jgi:predicted O-methyltransferase YrrM